MTSPTPSYIQVAPDSTGKKMECVQLTDDNGNTVYREMVSIGDPANVDQRVNVDIFGRMMVGSAPITPTQTNPNVIATGSGTKLLNANTNAKYRFIQNTTATPAWLDLANAGAAVGTGIYMGPYGEYEMSSQIGNMIQGQINAISTSGTIAFSVTEGV